MKAAGQAAGEGGQGAGEAADRTQADGQVAGGGQGVGVVLAEVAAAAGQGVFVSPHLGPAVITSHPRIVAPAARACQAPAIDRPAPHTFDSKTAAERWLTLTEAE